MQLKNSRIIKRLSLSLLLLSTILAPVVGLSLYILSMRSILISTVSISDYTFASFTSAVTEACVSSYEAVGAGGFLMLSIALIFVTYFLFRIINSLFSTAKWYRISIKVISSLPLLDDSSEAVMMRGMDFHTINIDEPIAFTSGLFFPKIYISKWYLENFSDAEINSLYSHESHHASFFHPLLILLERFISGAMPFYRGSEVFRSLLEANADESTISKSGSSLPILTGLEKVLLWGTRESSISSRFSRSSFAVAGSTLGKDRIEIIGIGLKANFLLRIVQGIGSVLFLLPLLWFNANFFTNVEQASAFTSVQKTSVECEAYIQEFLPAQNQSIVRFFTPAEYRFDNSSIVYYTGSR